MQVRNVTAKYIMKCDDDTFVRIDSILDEVRAKHIPERLYMGSMNELHRPLRTGKWAVTVEVCIPCKSSFEEYVILKLDSKVEERMIVRFCMSRNGLRESTQYMQMDPGISFPRILCTGSSRRMRGAHCGYVFISFDFVSYSIR